MDGRNPERAPVSGSRASRRTHARPRAVPGARGWHPRQAAGRSRTISQYFDGLLSWRPGRSDGRRSPAAAASAVDDADDVLSALIRLTDRLVALLEYRDPFFRSGSSLTRLLAGAIARQMELPDDDVRSVELAALLRDLGRMALGGQILPDPVQDPDLPTKQKIEQHVDLGLELLDGVALPDAVRRAIRHHHEKWDGSGYPDGLSADEIPLSARILAVADSFAAMIAPRPYRLPRRIPAALEELAGDAGGAYDPEVIEALLGVLANRGNPVFPFGLREDVVVVHADRMRATALAARLCSYGYLPRVAADLDAARELVKRRMVDALIVAGEVEGGDVPAFLRELRADDALALMPVVAVDAGAIQQRVELLMSGADTCFGRRAPFDEIRATVAALLARTARARSGGADVEPGAADVASQGRPYSLRGELAEFPLSWLLQMLNYNSATAAIIVRGARARGVVYVEVGELCHAETEGRVGEEAVRRMLAWRRGSYVVRPDARATERTVRRPLVEILLDEAVSEDEAVIFGTVQPEE